MNQVFPPIITILLSIFLIGCAESKASSPYSPQKYIPWKFGVIGDTQVRSWILKKAAKQMRNKGLLTVAHLGDVYWCGGLKYWWGRRRLMKMSGVYPWFIAMGNHAKAPCIISGIKSWQSTRKMWTNFWYRGVGDTMRVKDLQGWRFIALDTASEWLPTTHGRRFSHAVKTSPGPVVVFTHRPIAVPRVYNRRFIKRNIRYSTLDPQKYRGVNKKPWLVIQKYKQKIAAVFNGHYHGYIKYNLTGMRGYVSGGGGGNLESEAKFFYHWLQVTITGLKPTDFKVKVIRI